MAFNALYASTAIISVKEFYFKEDVIDTLDEETNHYTISKYYEVVEYTGSNEDASIEKTITAIPCSIGYNWIWNK